MTLREAEHLLQRRLVAAKRLDVSRKVRNTPRAADQSPTGAVVPLDVSRDLCSAETAVLKTAGDEQATAGCDKSREAFDHDEAQAQAVQPKPVGVLTGELLGSQSVTGNFPELLSDFDVAKSS